jgi:hypothetical protein
LALPLISDPVPVQVSVKRLQQPAVILMRFDDPVVCGWSDK